MNLLALSLTYKAVPISELEAVSIPTSALATELPRLLLAPEVLEAVALSTCNRVEVYAWGREPVAAAGHLRERLELVYGLPPAALEDTCSVLIGEEALRHLFLVTAGLESMVQGEPEIQGQVRDAYRVAASVGAVGPHLDRLFGWALKAGKSARSETGLVRSAESLPDAALRALTATLGDLRGRGVLVVGAGKVASSSLRALAEKGARTGVTARRVGSAAALAEAHDAEVVPFSAFEEALSRFDGVIFATAAPHALLEVPTAARVLSARDGRRLALIDLGLPRNVHPAVGALSNGDGRVMLYDLERLDREGYAGPHGRERQLARATAIALEEAERCAVWFRSRPADAVVAAIRDLADRVAAAEAALVIRRSPGLDERQREAIREGVRRGIRKIVHLPTARAKEACSRGDLEVLEAAKWLFALDGDAGEDGRDEDV